MSADNTRAMRVELDVSALEPPEPMQRILETLPTLDVGAHLLVRHRREPVPLYNILRQLGYSWHTRQGGAAGWEIFVWPAGDELAAAAVRKQLASR